MNPNETYDFLTNILRSGPEIAAAFILGAVLGAVVWRWLVHQGDKAKEEKIRSLEKEVGDLKGDLLKAKENEHMAVTASAEEKGHHQVTRLKLGTVEKEREAYRSAYKTLQTEKTNLTAQVDTLKKEREGLQAEAAKIGPLQTRLQAAEGEAAQTKGELEDAEARRKQIESTLRTTRSDKRELERKLETANTSLEAAQKERDAAKHEAADWEGRFKPMALLLEKAREAATAAARKAEEAISDSQAKDGKIKDLQGRIEPSESELARLKEQLSAQEDHLARVLAQEGRMWERPLSKSAPFVPLTDRRSTIISLLNLKGGVGKTTLALNIGATLAGTNKKVLLIDLDHQRSLGMLCLSAGRRLELQSQRLMLQYHLSSSDRSPLHFFQMAAPVQNVLGCHIITNSHPEDGTQGFGEIENNLLINWLTKIDSPDIRLFLREALHNPTVDQQFDYVLIDCPPRFSVGCINGLAASDFLLIPVNLDGTSPRAVPHLLKELKALRVPMVFPHLNVLGMVANRVPFYKGNPVAGFGEVWEELNSLAKVAWGEKIHQFKKMIQQSPKIGSVISKLQDSLDHNVAVYDDPAIADTFTVFTDELLRRIKNVSPKLSGVSS